ncbi:MAG: hypothetical protein A2284_15635 [Deltaproteobacteria bacterium RIFOXYA12_FULL_61_11]|nr:MAG: hypothetical protein A2284_15635 [Deltaproteobacteria bacterium RIFOXYA12_FULL_61_11]
MRPPVPQDSGREFALVLVLLLFFASWFQPSPRWFAVAALVALLALLWPKPLEPLARWWQFFGRYLGRYVSAFLFGGIYLILLTPIACLYRLTHRDHLRLQRPGIQDTVWRKQRHEYRASDLTHPF